MNTRALIAAAVLAAVAGTSACSVEAATPQPVERPSLSDRLGEYGVDTEKLGEKARDLAGQAEDLMGELAEAAETQGARPGAQYDRDAFGPAWYDADQNSCDTRNDILARDLTDLVMDGDDCTVLFGTLHDPYTGDTIEFERGRSLVDVDHIVALSAAWQMGADAWPEAKRVAFANDPENLAASYMGANRSKGDATLSEWMPENREFHCAYASSFVEVARKYDLTLAEADLSVARGAC